MAPDGELLMAGSLFSGYLGDPTPVPEWWPTGDLGRIDDDGFVHVLGRKKNLLITAYGRNVSPEWVETALRGQPALLQAVVFGDGAAGACRPCCGRWTRPPATPRLQAAVDAANATLPDYARIATLGARPRRLRRRQRPGHRQRPAAARRDPARACRCARLADAPPPPKPPEPTP